MVDIRKYVALTCLLGVEDTQGRVTLMDEADLEELIAIGDEIKKFSNELQRWRVSAMAGLSGFVSDNHISKMDEQLSKRLEELENSVWDKHFDKFHRKHQ